MNHQPPNSQEQQQDQLQGKQFYDMDTNMQQLPQAEPQSSRQPPLSQPSYEPSQLPPLPPSLCPRPPIPEEPLFQKIAPTEPSIVQNNSKT